MAKRSTGRNPAQARSQVSRVPPPATEGRNAGPVGSKADLAAQARAKPGQQAPAGPAKTAGGRSAARQKPGRGVRQARRGPDYSTEVTSKRTRGGR